MRAPLQPWIEQLLVVAWNATAKKDTKRERERARETDRRTDGRTDRRTDGQTDRRTERAEGGNHEVISSRGGSTSNRAIPGIRSSLAQSCPEYPTTSTAALPHKASRQPEIANSTSDRRALDPHAPACKVGSRSSSGRSPAEQRPTGL